MIEIAPGRQRIVFGPRILTCLYQEQFHFKSVLPFLLFIYFPYLVPFRGRKDLSGGDCNDPYFYDAF